MDEESVVVAAEDSVLVEVASTGAGASAPKVAGVGPVSAGASSYGTIFF